MHGEANHKLPKGSRGQHIRAQDLESDCLGSNPGLSLTS